jgi:hypothetical protein
MAITQAITNTFKQKLVDGSHDASDTFKMALYTSAATMDESTAAYSATNEVSGTGYTAGGVTMAGFSGTLSGSTAILDWTTDPAWTTATITARGALIYNSTDGTSVMVLDFGSDKTSTNGTFTVQLPTPDSTNGLIRLA